MANGQAVEIGRRTKSSRLAAALTIAGGETKHLPEAEAAHAAAVAASPKAQAAHPEEEANAAESADEVDS